MKKLFLIIFCISVLVSCKRGDVPAGIIKKENMIDILIDIHIAEAKVNHLGLKPDSAETLFKYYELQIYKDHKINDSVYLKSYNYYLNNLKSMEEIYTAVIDSLSLRERLLKTD